MADKQLLPLAGLSASCRVYLHEIRARGRGIYLAVLLALAALLVSLPFIPVDVNVRATGVIHTEVEPFSRATVLVGVMYLHAKDAGLVWEGQPIRLALDAYRYGRLGAIEATVSAVADSLVLDADNNAVFRTTCRWSIASLSLPDGHYIRLKPGMTFSAQFIVARTSVFQLLYDFSYAYDYR